MTSTHPSDRSKKAAKARALSAVAGSAQAARLTTTAGCAYLRPQNGRFNRSGTDQHTGTR